MGSDLRRDGDGLKSEAFSVKEIDQKMNILAPSLWRVSYQLTRVSGFVSGSPDSYEKEANWL